MFKKKCFICKQKDKKKNLNVHAVGNFQYYNNYYYHKKCLEVASCNAKDYNSSVLYLIIDINIRKKRSKARREKLLIDCNKICKELKRTKAPTGNPHQTI